MLCPHGNLLVAGGVLHRQQTARAEPSVVCGLQVAASLGDDHCAWERGAACVSTLTELPHINTTPKWNQAVGVLEKKYI